MVKVHDTSKSKQAKASSSTPSDSLPLTAVGRRRSHHAYQDSLTEGLGFSHGYNSAPEESESDYSDTAERGPAHNETGRDQL